MVKVDDGEVAAPPSGESRQPPPRYPESEMPVAGELPERWRRFAELREDYLLNYGYNTARAYWGDLQHLAEWADERGLDVLALMERDIKQYVALLRRRNYSESTIRRRLTTFRGLRRTMPARLG